MASYKEFKRCFWCDILLWRILVYVLLMGTLGMTDYIILPLVHLMITPSVRKSQLK